jgi:hypothetical protein
MPRFFLAASLLLFADFALAAALPPPPPPPPPAQTAQPQCIDARDSADFVPGVDAYGRPVAPADLPGSTTDVQVSTEVYVEMRSKNPRMPGVGVVANLPGLQKPPTCLKPPSPSIAIH